MMSRVSTQIWSVACAARSFVACAALAVGVIGAGGGVASADTVFETAEPGGFFGYIGFDIFTEQSVAARFTPAAECTLNTVSIWMMSNDFDGLVPQTVTVTLRTDTNPGGDFESVPSGTIIETWTATPSVVGWTPVLVDFTSVTHPTLAAGQKYWVVAESNLEAQTNPIWVWSSEGNEFTATNSGGATPWQSGSGAAIGLKVVGTPTNPPCIADFDGNGTASIDDLFIYFNAYFTNDPDADVNGNPGLSIDDLFFFINVYFVGC